MLPCRESPLGGRFGLRNAVLFLLLLLAPAAEALNVVEVRWGFDGRAVPDRINPVSILLFNPSSKPYDGLLSLSKRDAFGARLGAGVVEPCYLSPSASRWVQFYVPVEEPEETWTLAWGEGSLERAVLPVARLGAPATVMLDESEPGGHRSGAVPRLPDELFPTDVSCLDGLHSVLLDHAPRWERVRRQAFLDWLRCGGIVHVLHGEDGKFPMFSDEMAVLNSGAGRARIGAGLVVWDEVSRDQVAGDYLASKGFPPLELKYSATASRELVEDAIFERLESLSAQRHNWSLIYVLGICYIALVGPVGMVIGRLWRDWRRTLVLYLGVVTLFGTLFLVVGRQSAREGATVYTFSWARPLGQGDWDVAQWSSAFVTSSGIYRIRHPSSYSLYAVWKRRETMNGTIRNGLDALFETEIPLYSRRTFEHRGRFRAEPLNLALGVWEGSEDLTDFSLTGPVPAGTLAACAFYNGKLYPLALETNRLGLPGRQAMPISWSVPAGQDEAEASGNDMEGEFKQMLPSLILWITGRTEGASYYYWDQPATRDQVQVFILAPSPESFNLSQGSLGRERGYTAYHLTFFRAEK